MELEKVPETRPVNTPDPILAAMLVASNLGGYYPKYPADCGEGLTAYVRARLSNKRSRDPDFHKQLGLWNHHVVQIREQNTADYNLLTWAKELLIAKGHVAKTKDFDPKINRFAHLIYTNEFQKDALRAQVLDMEAKQRGEA